MKKKPNYKAWLHFAKVWGNNITSPARPCKSQLIIYNNVIKKIINNNNKPKALILGATPELRDLCIKNNFNTTVCDINLNMVKAMSSLMKYKGKAKEKIIIGDWLKTDFPKNNFDIILGDASLNQILNNKELKYLLKKLSFILKPNGFLLTREIVRLNKKPIINNNKWEMWYKKHKQNEISFMDLYFFYKYQSDVIKNFKSPNIIDFLPVLKKIEELVKNNKMEKEFLEENVSVLGNKSKKMLVYLKKDLEKLLRCWKRTVKKKLCVALSLKPVLPEEELK